MPVTFHVLVMRTGGPSLWLIWAYLSAIFGALTAICAKLCEEELDSDLTTFSRTIVVGVLLSLLLVATGKVQPLGGIMGRSWLFLVLSGLATSAA